MAGTAATATLINRGSDTSSAKVSGSFISAARQGRRCGWTICYPPGSSASTALPVVIVLHGKGGDHRSCFGSGVRLDHHLADAVRSGVSRFALASVDGGDGYWHQRASGEDAGKMVRSEFVPLLAGRGLRTDRLGFLGYSMGGYGSLLLGGELGSARVRAVVASSPALWRAPGDTAPGAFDDPADFAANTVFGRQSELAGIAVRLDCGTEDGFYPVAKAYAESLDPRPAGGFGSGGHNSAYWNAMAPAELAFLGEHL